jgi:hypothetical protein
LQSCFLLCPFYCPLTPHFLCHWRKRRHLKSSLQTNNTSEPTLLWGTGHYYCRGVINLSSLNSPSRTLSCLQIKIISCELQNISGNTVTKKMLFLLILLFLLFSIATRRPRLHSNQSDAPQYVKSLDSTILDALLFSSTKWRQGADNTLFCGT